MCTRRSSYALPRSRSATALAFHDESNVKKGCLGLDDCWRLCHTSLEFGLLPRIEMLCIEFTEVNKKVLNPVD